MPLIYAFVSRETTVLAEYTPYTGLQQAPDAEASSFMQFCCSLGGAPIKTLAAPPLVAGNFNTVAIECLQKLNNPDSKFTIACDRHTFNFLVHNGFSKLRVKVQPRSAQQLPSLAQPSASAAPSPALTRCKHLHAAYLVVADEAYGRQIPFAFLERVRDEFEEKFADKGRASPAHSLDRTFG